jgi:lipopolysaccharide/colanic/teichoic acid biosynthesis glycosyltransferase
VRKQSISVAISSKRIVDIILSASLLLLLAPALVILCFVISFDARGSPFYKQKRLGWKKKPFTIYKFRTMRDSEAGPNAISLTRADMVPFLYSAKNDPRVTRLGRWLRRYGIDELPQLVNVFWGKMSLVGPRPFDLRDFEQGPFGHPLYSVWVDNRHLTRPGITGLWQIRGRNDTTFYKLIRLDLYYVTRWTFLLELKILWRTLGVVWRAAGA